MITMLSFREDIAWKSEWKRLNNLSTSGEWKAAARERKIELASERALAQLQSLL